MGGCTLAGSREYPERPVVGVGGVVIRDGKALLIRRGSEPLKGQWSIPGGALELGEKLEDGVKRELLEETGLGVRVLELIEVFERISQGEMKPEVADPDGAGLPAPSGEVGSKAGGASQGPRPRYHFVIADYLCEAAEGGPVAGSDVTDVAFVAEADLGEYGLTPTATRVLKRAFVMARERALRGLQP